MQSHYDPVQRMFQTRLSNKIQYICFKGLLQTACRHHCGRDGGDELDRVVY